ncbi:hypothetical protein J6590_024885 [Homalodisca vitripennis]|nr:hypothetical protein J6590_024885 [Homalodisca vitripennis]
MYEMLRFLKPGNQELPIHNGTSRPRRLADRGLGSLPRGIIETNTANLVGEVSTVHCYIDSYYIA